MIHLHEWSVFIEEVGVGMLPFRSWLPESISIIHVSVHHETTRGLRNVSPQCLRHIKLLWYTEPAKISLYKNRIRPGRSYVIPSCRSPTHIGVTSHLRVLVGDINIG